MARSGDLYKSSPTMKRGEDGNMGVSKPAAASGEQGAGANMAAGAEDGSIDGAAMKPHVEAMHERHMREMKDMHKRHEDEHGDMHKRHQKEHATLHEIVHGKAHSEKKD